MICPYCKKNISSNSGFCPECGQEVKQLETVSKDSEQYWAKVKQEVDRNEALRKEEEEKLEQKRKAKEKTVKKIILIFASVCIFAYYMFIIKPSMDYNNAEKMLTSGEYEAAKRIYESLGEYRDSQNKVEVCDAKIIEQDYEDAIAVFNEGQFEDALNDFRMLDGYEESNKYVLDCEISILKEASKGDIVVYGNYDDKALEWLVLSVSNEEALLISRYYITSMIANESNKGEYGKYNCWSNSTLRNWLNDEFVSDAFSSEEATRLLINHVATDEYDVTNYDGWNAIEISVTTKDKVYIPSKADVNKYDLLPVSLFSKSNNAPITGWLRDHGHAIAYQSCLNSDGTYGSEWHFYSSYGIRPMIRIVLSEELNDFEKTNDELSDSMELEEIPKDTIQETQENIQEIPLDAYLWNEHYYAVYSNCNSWEEAMEYCESLGGYLATITSEEENEELFNYISELGYKGAYFGLSDNIEEGTWYWVNGEKVDYLNWHAPNEPNAESAGEDYAMFYYKYNDGTWNDGTFSNDGVAFICEWD